MKNLEKKILFFLLSLIIIYIMQDVVNINGSTLIFQVSLLLIFVISGFYWVRFMFIRFEKSTFYKMWSALLLINLFGYIFTADHSLDQHFGQLRTIIFVLIPFFPIYHFSRNKVLESKHLQAFLLIIIVIAIAQFYSNQSQILFMRETSNENVVNNIAYVFVFLIPYLFLFTRRKIFSTIIAIVIMYFIIQGAKRGAILAGGIGILCYLYFQFINIDKKKKVTGIVFAGIGVLMLCFIGYEFLIKNTFLIERVSLILENDSSGRNIIYTNLFNAWYQSESFINFLFGYGFGSSLFLSGLQLWAHNDWLELLINFGLVGVCIYLLLFASALKVILKKKLKKNSTVMLVCVLSIWFFVTIVSMGYTSLNSIYQTIILAYIFGSNSKSLASR